MSQTVGIDIGSYSIKFAFLEISKFNVTLTNVVEVPLSKTNTDEEKTSKIQALQKILSTQSHSNSNPNDNIYVGLGSQHAVLQNFDFLKISTKNLPKVVANEFDSLGLFSPNEYCIELNILEKDSKHSAVLGILVKKLAVSNLVELLTSANITCRIIDIECLAFQNLIPYVPQLTQTVSQIETAATNLVINIGHSKTSIIVIENDTVVLERSFNLAGHYITSKIQKECKISYEEAQNLKHSISDVVNIQSNNATETKNILIECLTEISKEVERIVLSFTRSTQSKKINSVLLTGGSTKAFECAKIFEKVLGLRVVNLKLFNENFKNISSNELIFETFSQSIALAMRGTAAKHNSQTNIRHGEFALISDYANIIEHILSYTKTAAIVLVCLIATYSIRSYLYNKKIYEIKNLFAHEILEYFGTEPPKLKIISMNPNWSINQYSETGLQLIQQTYQGKIDFIEDFSSKKTIMPLLILNEISSAVPKSVYFEVSNYRYQDKILNITADTNSKESVKKIVDFISSIKYITNVQKKSEIIKSGTNDKLITFSLIATIQTQE